MPSVRGGKQPDVQVRQADKSLHSARIPAGVELDAKAEVIEGVQSFSPGNGGMGKAYPFLGG